MTKILKKFTSSIYARCELVCFPYAGAGPRVFRRWPSYLSPFVNVSVVHLPGREERIAEPPQQDLEQVVEELSGAIAPLTKRPVVLFGHSLGGTLAARVAQELFEGVNSPQAVLFVSARRAPWRGAQHAPETDGLAEERTQTTVESLYSLGGNIEQVAADPKLAEVIMPALKADLVLSDARQGLRERALSFPVIALWGMSDNEVPIQEMQQWRQFTSGSFESIAIDGDHFFIESHTEEVVGIVDTVARHLVRE